MLENLFDSLIFPCHLKLREKYNSFGLVVDVAAFTAFISGWDTLGGKVFSGVSYVSSTESKTDQVISVEKTLVYVVCILCSKPSKCAMCINDLAVQPKSKRMRQNFRIRKSKMCHSSLFLWHSAETTVTTGCRDMLRHAAMFCFGLCSCMDSWRWAFHSEKA